MRFEVQQRSLCGGWANTWSIDHADGSCEAETFASQAEAEAELALFLAEIGSEIALGLRSEDAGYDRAEFRVVRACEA